MAVGIEREIGSGNMLSSSKPLNNEEGARRAGAQQSNPAGRHFGRDKGTGACIEPQITRGRRRDSGQTAKPSCKGQRQRGSRRRGDGNTRWDSKK